MGLEEFIKKFVKKDKEFQRGILTSSEAHPIVYFSGFNDSEEYKILNYFAEKRILKKEEQGNLIYFFVTDSGKKYFV